MRLSYSSFELYKQCSLKFKFKEIDKMKEPKSLTASFGSLLHSVLEYVHSPSFSPPTLEQALDFFVQKFNSITPLFKEEGEERNAFTQGVEILQRYYKTNDIAAITVVDLESHFALELLDPETNETHIISGIIDRIDKTDTGYEIIDYKTAKKMPPQKYADENTQLSIYLRAFLKRYPKEKNNIKNIAVSLYFLKHGVKLSSFRTEEQLEKIDTEFLEVIRGIQAEKFHPHVSPLCDYCGFKKICPMWRHSFEEEQETNAEDARLAIREYLDIRERSSIEKKRLAELQSIIIEYMNREEVERVFDGEKIIERSVRTTFDYDIDAVKKLLDPRGLFDRVVKIDGTALKKLSGEIPFSLKSALEKTKKPGRETTALSVKKRK